MPATEVFLGLLSVSMTLYAPALCLNQAMAQRVLWLSVQGTVCDRGEQGQQT